MSLELISMKREDGDIVKLMSNINNDKPLRFEVRVYGEENGEHGSCSKASDCPDDILEFFMFEMDMEQNIFNLTCVASRLEYGFDHFHCQHDIMTQVLCRIQNELGQGDGGFAGMFFSGPAWFSTNTQGRVHLMADYVASEIRMCGGQEDDR